MITDKSMTNIKHAIIKKVRSFDTLNKVLNGVKITKIDPARLLIKNRGYLEMLFQKSFIK